MQSLRFAGKLSGTQLFRDDVKLVLKPLFCIGVSFLMLTFPLKWVLSWIAAAAVHEAAHYLALKICRVKVHTITLNYNGAVMETEPISKGKEFLCAVSGPIGGLSLLLFFEQIPYIAICAFIQSIYNLLPIFPLDGGRAFRCMVLHLLPRQYALKIHNILELIILTGLLMLGIYCLFCLSLGPIPLMGTLLILLRQKPVKFPCKRRKQAVQ